MTYSTDILQLQNGWTPLHFAVNQDHLEIVELLLEHGAAVDIESNVCYVMGTM